MQIHNYDSKGMYTESEEAFHNVKGTLILPANSTDKPLPDDIGDRVPQFDILNQEWRLLGKYKGHLTLIRTKELSYQEFIVPNGMTVDEVLAVEGRFTQAEVDQTLPLSVQDYSEELNMFVLNVDSLRDLVKSKVKQIHLNKEKESFTTGTDLDGLEIEMDANLDSVTKLDSGYRLNELRSHQVMAVRTFNNETVLVDMEEVKGMINSLGIVVQMKLHSKWVELDEVEQMESQQLLTKLDEL